MAKRSDSANYWALLIIGIALVLLGGLTGGITVPLGVLALVGAGFYNWKTEKR